MWRASRYCAARGAAYPTRGSSWWRFVPRSRSRRAIGIAKFRADSDGCGGGGSVPHVSAHQNVRVVLFTPKRSQENAPSSDFARGDGLRKMDTGQNAQFYATIQPSVPAEVEV